MERPLFSLEGGTCVLAALLSELEVEYPGMEIVHVRTSSTSSTSSRSSSGRFYLLVRLPTAIQIAEFEDVVSRLSRSDVVTVN